MDPSDRSNLPRPDALNPNQAVGAPRPRVVRAAPGYRPSQIPKATPPRAPRNFGSLFIFLLILAGLGGAWWYFIERPRREDSQAENDKQARAEPQTPAQPTPVPVKADSTKPVAQKSPMVAPSPEPQPEIPKSPEPAVASSDSSIALFQLPLPLDSVAASSTKVQERWSNLVRIALQKNLWTNYVDLLGRSLDAELKRSPDFDSVQRYDRFTGNPYFVRAMLERALGAMASEDTRKAAAEDERVRQHIVWLSENIPAMESLLAAITPKNNLRDVLETWATLAADDPDALGKYRELAVACSLVLERPKESRWNGQKLVISAADRYRWYKSKDQAGLLASKLTKLSAWQLSWVVGVSIPETEMEWALKELARKVNMREWGRTYSMVPYDMEKAVTGKMKKPYDAYTFAEILKKGGICDDRAYFAANTARAAGIPAVKISGDGPRGPHAWIAWLIDDDQWAFSGRFDGYPAGRVTDRRTGEELSEQRFTRLSDSHAPSQLTRMKAQRLVWIYELQSSLGQSSVAPNALEFALKTSPHDVDLWHKKLAAWKAIEPPLGPEIWKPFLDALRREFRDDTDILASARRAEDKYVLAKVDAGAVKAELRGDVRDLSKLKGLQSLDEIRIAHKRYAELFVQSRDYTGLRHIYRAALDDYGREAAKFKALARDYWKFVKDATDDVRKAACRDIEGAYEHHVETRGGDYFDITSQNTAASAVAQCWREAGETARAERIEKEIAKRAKNAKKNAL